MNTRNEEENLRRVFHCMESVVSDIIVVDCESTDNTRELARKLGAKVYNIGQCPGFGDMRTISVHLAKTDWAIILDGDESMDEVDVQKIPELIKMDVDLIWLPRQHYQTWDRSICENPDLSVYSDWQARMVRVKPSIYLVKRVHEEIRGIAKGRDYQSLSNPVIRHFGYLKTPERLQAIVDLCNKLYKEDQENKDLYELENLIGCASGETYWREAPLYHANKHE